MAITKIHAIQATVNKAVDYICNPAKTDESILISSFGCSPETAALLYTFSFPSGKIILNTKKKITIDTPPVIKVTSKLYTAGGTYIAATGIQRLLNPLQINEIIIQAIKYQ